MMGIIFEAVREVITAEHGESTWDDLLEAAGVDGAYTRLGNYPFEELGAIVDRAAEALGATPEQVWQSTGSGAFVPLAAQLPRGLDDFSTSRDLFASLDQTIHRRVASLHPQSQPPKFAFSEEDGLVTLAYSSRRGLCHLATGLAEGAVAAFDDAADVEQVQCRKEEGGPCLIQIRYHR